MFDGHNNRRLHVRFEANESFKETTWWREKNSLIASLFNKHFTALVSDISPGGCSFFTDEPPALNDFVGVNIGYGNYSSFPLTGRVRAVIEVGSDDSSGEDKPIHKVSIQYVHCNEKSVDYLKRLLQRMKNFDHGVAV